MAKKQTEEEKIISQAADIIMQTIHIAANRIAEKYERQLMNEVVTRIQAQSEAKEKVREYTGNVINDKLNNLSKE